MKYITIFVLIFVLFSCTSGKKIQEQSKVTNQKELHLDRANLGGGGGLVDTENGQR